MTRAVTWLGRVVVTFLNRAERGVSRLVTRGSRADQVWRFIQVSRLLLTMLWVMTRERNRVMRAHQHGRTEVQPDTEALRRVLSDFRQVAITRGGLLIKLGQFLGARADLLPPEALAELASLHDEVPAEPFAAIEQVLRAELHAPLNAVFASVDPVPAGSASLGQVHRAVLLDGREVAVKVQRPYIEDVVRADLATVRFVMAVLRQLVPVSEAMLDLRGLYKEFSRMIYEELDYHHEGRNAERFARVNADDPNVYVPQVYWPFSTRRVLTLEWVDGIKIGDLAALDRAGIDRSLLASRLVELYLVHLLRHGLFHADPHPGNFFVRPVGESGFQLAFVDFGMLGRITPTMKHGLRDCLTGFVWRDSNRVARGLATLGFLGRSANRQAIEQAVAILMERFGETPLGELRSIDPMETMEELQVLLYDQPLRLPAEFAFLGRAASMLVGLVTLLAPEFSFLEAAIPYVRREVHAGGLDEMLHLLGVESMGQLSRVIAREGIAMARTVATLPALAQRVLEHVEHGDLRLIIEAPDPHSRLSTQLGRRFVANALLRPVPVWIPLGMAGAATSAFFMRRRRQSH